MTSSDVILVDEVPSYRRVALIRDGVLDGIWIDDDTLSPYQCGAVVGVRINRIFPDHHRTTVTLDGISGSLRLSDKQNHHAGDMIAAMVMSAARDDGYSNKPLQLKEVSHIAQQDLPSDTGLITPAPDARANALAASLNATVIEDHDGSLWQQHDVDIALEQALRPDLDLAEGGRVIISTPPGAAIIDGDSADSQLPPLALAEAMVPTVMRQLRLRRIGGPIVIDFPRLDQDGMKKIHNMMRLEAKKDALKPSLHGFTRGGLYTMARPWRDRLLADDMLPQGRALGLAAFRLIRAHHATMAPGSLNLRLHQDGIDWLNGAGASLFHDMMASMSFQVHLFPDNLTHGVVRGD